MPRAVFALPVLLALGGPAGAFQDLDGSLLTLPTVYRGFTTHYLGKGLRDPESLQLRNIRGLFDTNRSAVLICGEANARNGFGGYVGFEPFAVRVYPDNRTDTFFPTAWEPAFRPDMRAAVKRAGC